MKLGIIGTCKYCGLRTSLIRNRAFHENCQDENAAGRNTVFTIAKYVASGKGEQNELSDALQNMADASFINSSEVQEALILGWESAIKDSLGEGVLSEEAEHRLISFKGLFSLPEDDRRVNRAYTDIVKAGSIRELLQGKVPSRIEVAGIVPFIFHVPESLIWIFRQVPYLNPASRILLGRGEGEGIPFMEGLYHSPQIFESRTIGDDVEARLDIGTVAVTTHNIYFSGRRTSFKFSYSGMLIVDPYKNGILIKQEELTGFQAFVTGDGWFTYNLISNLARWQAKRMDIRPADWNELTDIAQKL